MALGKQNEETTSRLTPIEREAMYAKRCASVVENALKGEKVRYKSDCDSEKFKGFLEDRLTIWGGEKDKTFHGKRMYEKTKTLIDNWS